MEASIQVIPLGEVSSHAWIFLSGCSLFSIDFYTCTMHWGYFVCCLLYFSKGCLADTNGMDMSTDGSMALAVGNMLTYLHFTPGDNRGSYIFSNTYTLLKVRRSMVPWVGS
jgi:hypothetical protein